MIKIENKISDAARIGDGLLPLPGPAGRRGRGWPGGAGQRTADSEARAPHRAGPARLARATGGLLTAVTVSSSDGWDNGAEPAAWWPMPRAGVLADRTDSNVVLWGRDGALRHHQSC